MKIKNNENMFSSLLSYLYPINEESVQAAPARNMPPDFLIKLREARFNLQKLDMISDMRAMDMSEAQAVRRSLRKVTTLPTRTFFPCENPLFHELRTACAVRQIGISY
jgi:hypothetical protein